MSSELELKQAGLKVTMPRVRILRMLEESEQRHLSAEQIYQRLLKDEAEVGLGTVYRVLTQFESARLVIRHRFAGGGSKFELANREHHDHIVCVKCGEVEEFEDDEIERRQEAIARKHSFTLVGHELNLYGLCPVCQKT